MGKITIYLSIENGVLVYRDSEEHQGQTIVTQADPGDTLIWKLGPCSGIKEITAITVSGSDGFLKYSPIKKDFDRWKSEVSRKATGEISYFVSIEPCQASATSIQPNATRSAQDNPPPKIKIDPTP